MCPTLLLLIFIFLRTNQAIIALMSAVDDDDIAVRLTACDSWSFLIQWFHARLLDFVTERGMLFFKKTTTEY